MLLHRLDSWWMEPLDARPLAVFRIAVGLFSVIYLVVRWPSLVSGASFEPRQFEPVGVATIMSQPLAAWMVYTLLVGAIVTGVAFTLGWRHPLTGPLFAVLLLWALTYRNSWGQIFHSENLLVLHVIVLAIAPSADALSIDASRHPEVSHDRMKYGWPLRLCALLTVITYVIAGWAKADISGLEWITGDGLRNYVASDNLRKELLGDYSSPLGAWLVDHGWIFKPLAAMTIVVEIGAPVALFGRRIALAWSATAWMFHIGVLATMMIPFPYPLVGLAFLPLFAWDGEPIVTWLARSTGAIGDQLQTSGRRRVASKRAGTTS